jgi:hypothetical protein
MHENILAVLTADESKPLSVVKPLYRSLLHINFPLLLMDLPLDQNRGSYNTARCRKPI